MALVALARTTWRRRGSAKKHALSFDEEAVTQTILMDLADHYPGHAVIVPFNKVQEGKIGADWAWAFVNVDETKVFPMLVQAKALDLNDIEYPEIKRFIGKTSIRQIDRLIATAASLGWPPLYAFYNHLDDCSRIPNTCGTIEMARLAPAAETWGVSIADAYQVRAALIDQSFDTHCLHSKPLHCLLCSMGSGIRPPGGSPDLAFRSVRSFEATVSADGAVSARPDGLKAPLDGLPQMFRDARDLLSIENHQQRERARGALAEKYQGIAGAVILRDAKPERRKD